MQRLRPFLHGGRPSAVPTTFLRSGNGSICVSIRCRSLLSLSLHIRDHDPRGITRSRHFSTTSTQLSSEATARDVDVVTWSDLRKEEEAKKQREIEEQQRRANGEDTNIATGGAGAPPPSQGAALLKNLAREPIVPRPANMSVLVEPAIQYKHRSETFHSRMRHGKSVFRQERLEIIRQAQDRPLADWRTILQRLAAATPGKDDLLMTDENGRVLAPRLSTGLTPAQFSQLYSPNWAPAPLAPLLQQEASRSSDASSPKSLRGQYRRNAVSLALPKDSPAVEELLHGVDGTLWKIAKRSGSILRLYQRDDGKSDPVADKLKEGAHQDSSDDYPWLLTFSGSMPSIYRAASEVNFFAKDAVHVAVSSKIRLDDRRPESHSLNTEQGPAPGSESPAEPSSQTDTQAETLPSEAGSEETQTWNLVSSSYYLDDSNQLGDHVFFPHVTDIGAHQIPRPPVWTSHSFERYVAALVNGRPPTSLAAELYPQIDTRGPAAITGGNDAGSTSVESTESGDDTGSHILNSHDRTVVNILHSLFNDDSLKHVLSLSAFKMALGFISKHGETYRPEARSLYVRAELLDLRMDTDTFNILLASLVKTQDLRNFGSTLSLMVNRGYVPNLTTWVLFLRLFESEEVKRHILHAMQARAGLLDSAEALQCVAQEMAEYDALRAIYQKGQDHNEIASPAAAAAVFFDEFMGAQAERYGQDWLTRPAANKILEVFSRAGRFTECQELLGILTRKQGVRDHIEQLKLRQKREQQQEQPQDGLVEAAQPEEPQSPPATHDVIASQALNTFSFNIVLTHAKIQQNLRQAINIIRQMDAVDKNGFAELSAGRQYQNESDQDQGQSRAQDWSVVDTSTALPMPRITNSRSVPADAVTYNLLQEMAFHRRLAYVTGAVWIFASIQRQVNHWMKKKVGRILAGDTPTSARHLATVLRGDVDGATKYLGSGHAGAGNTSFPAIGAAASGRWAAYYEGWEPATPLSQVLQEAMKLDNMLLKDRYEHGYTSANALASRPPPPPLRIPLRRKLVQRQRKPGQTKKHTPGYDPGNGPAFVEIQPDWLPPKVPLQKS